MDYQLLQLCLLLIALITYANPAKNYKAKVIVVGAGAAGISATQRLLEQNFDVTLLEASERWGGRLWSTPVPGGWVELGGQWIHGNEHYLYNLASASNMLKPYADFVHLQKTFVAPSGMLSHGAVEQFEDVNERLRVVLKEQLSNISEFTFADRRYLSAGEFLLKRFKEIRNNFSGDVSLADRAYDSFVRDIKAEYAVDSLHDMALQAFTGHDQVGPAATDLTMPYTNILKKIGPAAVHGVLLNNYVKQIRQDSVPSLRMLQVETANGEIYDADHVIVTASMGHIKKHLTTLFSPTLSAKKQEAIRAVGFGTFGKIHLLYEQPWWMDIANGTVVFNVIFDNDVDLLSDPELRYNNRTWIRAIEGFYANPTAANVLLVALGGNFAEEMENLTDDQVAADLTHLLNQLTQTTVPPPTKVYRGMWHSNDLFLGTYSCFSNVMAKLELTLKDLAEPEYFYRKVIGTTVKSVPGLLFAGEATHSGHPSTVTGAILSGFREADRIHSIYNLIS